MKELCPWLLSRDHDEATCPSCSEQDEVYREYEDYRRHLNRGEN
jgi:uncharacterized C2H2 Zn-finger protein